jgi:hypothetical protein
MTAYPGSSSVHACRSMLRKRSACTGTHKKLAGSSGKTTSIPTLQKHNGKHKKKKFLQKF